MGRNGSIHTIVLVLVMLIGFGAAAIVRCFSY